MRGLAETEGGGKGCTTTLRVKRFLLRELPETAERNNCITGARESARTCVCVCVCRRHFVGPLNACRLFRGRGFRGVALPLPPRVFNRLWTKAYFMSDSKIARIQDRMNKGLEVKEKAGSASIRLLHRLAHTAQLLS